MGDLLQYFYGVEYHYKIQLKKVSNYTYFCLLYNMDALCLLGLVAGFRQEMGWGLPVLAVFHLLYYSVGICDTFVFANYLTPTFKYIFPIYNTR
jgi:hypothetical protein